MNPEDAPTTTTTEEEVAFFVERQKQISTAQVLRESANGLRKVADELEFEAKVIEASVQKFNTALRG